VVDEDRWPKTHRRILPHLCHINAELAVDLRKRATSVVPGYTCQICGMRLEVVESTDVVYDEAAFLSVAS
jgi:hypothetical protein